MATTAKQCEKAYRLLEYPENPLLKNFHRKFSKFLLCLS